MLKCFAEATSSYMQCMEGAPRGKGHNCPDERKSKKNMFYNEKKISNLCPSMRQIAAMEDWVKNQSERIQRRFARFKLQVEKYWKLYPWLMSVVLCAILMSCRSQQIIIPNDTTTNTNRYHGHYERDSIYLHDSIYVREYIKGDTIFIDKIVEHFKDRWLTRTDTLSQTDTVTITQTITQTITEKEKYVPGFYKWCAGILIVFVLFLIFKYLFRFFVK